jgi:prepilin signal peptidase PulO-like enzyme (type II secretory pathway)
MLTFYIFIVGIFVGSFLNVLADRLSFEESILGRSHCSFCKKNIEWYDLIPVISFIRLNAKCRYCHTSLSFWYPVSEILTGLLFLLTWLYIPGSLIDKGISLGIVACLITIFLADIKYQIIPDEILIALGIFSLWFAKDNFPDHIIAAAFLGSLFYLVYFLTKKRGMGFGDVKFAIGIGLLLGVKSGLLSIYLSFLIGGVIGIILLLGKFKKMKSKIAFGPFLIIGVMLMLFFNTPITHFFYRLLGLT